jgi:protein SCO1/2
VIRRTFLLPILAVALVSGCHRSAKQEAPSAADTSIKVYHLRGKVVSTNPAKREVTVDHEAIPGFMEAMTMPYTVKDPNVLTELHPGDVITADVLVSPNPDADYLLDHIVVVGQAKPDYKPKVSFHVPTPGDAVPDFAMRNQDGRTIHLEQFRGKELLITFIYTRCPLPNFCPRVTRNFAELNQRLKSDAALYAKSHLLCVSFDPDHDTPERLRAYGTAYSGSDAKSAFAHWDFAVPQMPEVDKMAQFFDVGLTREPDSTITHTLSTTLIGPDGKVLHFYPGNDWTVDQVLADMKQAAGGQTS